MEDKLTLDKVFNVPDSAKENYKYIVVTELDNGEHWFYGAYSEDLVDNMVKALQENPNRKLIIQ